ncbi:MAG: hypothetical protein DRJ66_06020 [Thermoprotei archaeon]|nr:MAG: hypothetical protein DRJ66_06020 [Thermoprotei archaeon]RLF19713.1 MAG: hypothetical protein DRZ82_04645 [Thermoprotei archaeon]
MMKIRLDGSTYDEEFAFVICYPYPTEEEYLRRIRSLIEKGIEEIVLEGTSNIGKYRVLGKGFRGVVVKARSKFGMVAVKLRRVDSPRDDLLNEARFLRIANAIGVGPLVYAYDRDFIIMELVEGSRLPDWILAEKDQELIRKVIIELLEQAVRLDLIGLDHGELSRPIRHVLITKDGRPYILDFESASLERRPRNLTGIIQYLLIRESEVSKRLNEIFEIHDKKSLIEAIRQYKRTPSLRTFKAILKRIGVEGVN